MKTLQHTLKLAMVAFILVFASCSKDDNPSEDSTVIEEPTNHELLISGKWYIQSTSNGNYNECERQSYFQFIDEDTLLLQSFFQNGQDCEAQSIVNIEYQMIGDDAFIFVQDPSDQFIIDLISETQLILNLTDGVDSNIIRFQK